MRTTYQCGNCASIYRDSFDRCPRCGGPGSSEAAHGDTGPVANVGVSPVPSRPQVNAPKADHAAYASVVHGRPAEWWDGNYSKRDLIDTLDRLSDGRMLMGAAGVVDTSTVDDL